MCFSIKHGQHGEPIKKEINSFSDPFPYLATNIGSGVSITLVKSEDEFLIKNGELCFCT